MVIATTLFAGTPDRRLDRIIALPRTPTAMVRSDSCRASEVPWRSRAIALGIGKPEWANTLEGDGLHLGDELVRQLARSLRDRYLAFRLDRMNFTFGHRPGPRSLSSLTRMRCCRRAS